MGGKEQECRKLKRAARNIGYENAEARFIIAMIHTRYDKMRNIEESVDVFAQIDTRKLEQKTLF